MKRWLACLTLRIMRRILSSMRDDEFLKLFEQWSQALWCLVCSRVDANCADDVCQETWLRAWRSRDKFTGGNFKAWLFSIAGHLLIDELRKRQPLPLADEHYPPDRRAPKPLDVIIGQEVEAAVAECMGTLPPQEAAVMKMRTDGSSSKEIAQALGVKVERVHTLYFQAKQKMNLCVERKLS